MPDARLRAARYGGLGMADPEGGPLFSSLLLLLHHESDPINGPDVDGVGNRLQPPTDLVKLPIQGVVADAQLRPAACFQHVPRDDATIGLRELGEQLDLG